VLEGIYLRIVRPGEQMGKFEDVGAVFGRFDCGERSFKEISGENLILGWRLESCDNCRRDRWANGLLRKRVSRK
jgi:hypothetical protein